MIEKPSEPFPPDEWTGVGGEYVRDPKTGKRYPREVWESMQEAPRKEAKPDGK